MYYDKENQYRSKFGLKGKVEIKLFGPDGKLKDMRVVKTRLILPNTVTTFGDKLVANRMSGATLAAISHMGIGTGTGGGSGSNSLVAQLEF